MVDLTQLGQSRLLPEEKRPPDAFLFRRNDLSPLELVDKQISKCQARIQWTRSRFHQAFCLFTLVSRNSRSKTSVCWHKNLMIISSSGSKLNNQFEMLCKSNRICPGGSMIPWGVNKKIVWHTDIFWWYHCCKHVKQSGFRSFLTRQEITTRRRCPHYWNSSLFCSPFEGNESDSDYDCYHISQWKIRLALRSKK